MKPHFYYLLLLLFWALVPALSFAQTGPPADPVDAPIDGGLVVLLAAGAGYGVKKYRDQRKKKSEQVNKEEESI